MRFKLFSGLAVSCTALVLSACASPQTNVDIVDDSPRSSTELADGWMFSFGELGASALTTQFTSEDWESVSVPHSWNRVGYYMHDLTDHEHTVDNVNKDLGQGWYRLEFTSPATDSDERLWLEFDAASRTAEVWLNGTRLGEHRAPFTRFRFDVTDVVVPGGENLLVVKTDNSKPEPGSPTADVLPIAGDFFVHGGIYRPVRLVVTNQIHVDMQDYGGPGVYAVSSIADDGSASVSVRSRVTNTSDTDGAVVLRTSLVDEDGVAIAEASSPGTLVAGETTEMVQLLEVADPMLWQGMKNPYLYTLQTEILSDTGATLDKIDQDFGIREITIDPDKGFLLNREPIDLHGVAYHQDREGRGWAVTREDIESDIEIMEEIGANTIRLAHYPHGQPVHEMANEKGFILWDEIPLVTSWAYEAKDEEINAALAENARLQMKEMIRQNFNHPSVAVWGIANEVDFGVILPVFLGAPPSDLEDPMPLLLDLAALARAEDPSRPDTLANCCEARAGLPPGVELPVTADAVNVNGANRYYGWYYGKPDDLGPHLDKLREIRPEQPLSVSEYGAGGGISIHTDDPYGGPVASRGVDQPEEYMNLVHEENWADIAERDYLWASWVWNGFDFATTIRTEGDAIDINTKGLVSYDRRVKKDPFYLYKANWSDTPTVYVAGRRYVQRAYPVTDVRVYSNADATELQINGVSQGVREDCPNAICVWDAVRLSAGTNDILVEGQFGSTTEVDEVEWQLAPEMEDAFHIDSGTLVAADSETEIIGSDAFYKGGEAGSSDVEGGFGRPDKPADIADTLNRELATTYRQGDFSYELPLEDGDYTVTLVFMEPELAPGERIFSVLANGVPVLEGLDIANEAGASLTEIRKTIPVNVTGGKLSLAFKPEAGDAIVSAVFVDPA